ncbi:MAG: GNAT family N-acetyltransferase [Deltaproteobacteria bacterium]|nr:GNAT family N-acetyltransferase [Deltaproteobacteria bacterium]MBW2063918.1 GNAT family N-acetyltransferase [Deltaproteobacteria bacterium]
MFLSGQRVYLRAFEERDIPRWQQWFNDSEVTAEMEKGFYPNTVESQKQFWENMYNDRSNLQLAIVSVEDDKVVGSIGLHQISFIHGTADISILIGEKAYWRQGLAKEAMGLIIEHAFNKLNLHKLTGGMYSSNEGSKRLFEAMGFRKEGELREQVKVRGEYISVLKYGLTAYEWMSRRGGR